jgi:hypothetical protein
MGTAKSSLLVKKAKKQGIDYWPHLEAAEHHRDGDGGVALEGVPYLLRLIVVQTRNGQLVDDLRITFRIRLCMARSGVPHTEKSAPPIYPQ